jgi:hypothetical protein
MACIPVRAKGKNGKGGGKDGEILAHPSPEDDRTRKKKKKKKKNLRFDDFYDGTITS